VQSLPAQDGVDENRPTAAHSMLSEQVEYVPDAPAPRPTVARVIVTDGSNPARAGMDAAAFAVAQERGRFDKARRTTRR
jgi:hypothetical protein